METFPKKDHPPLDPSWITSGLGYQKTVLDNGIKVITEEIPYLKSVSIGVWVKTGSRDEQPQENGHVHPESGSPSFKHFIFFAIETDYDWNGFFFFIGFYLCHCILIDIYNKYKKIVLSRKKYLKR